MPKQRAIAGQAEPYALVKLFDTDGTALGQALADAQGNWQVTTGPLADGSHAITAQAIDAMGTRSFVSDPLNITVDSSLVPLTFGLANDTGRPNTPLDRITSDPTIAGRVERVLVSSVALRLGSTPEATFVDITNQLAADGTFRLSRADLERISGQTLVEGPQTVTIQVKNDAGQIVATQPLTFTLDTVGPSVAVNSLTDGVYWTNQETLEGRVSTFNPGDVLFYYLDGNAQTPSYLTPNATGQFSRDPLALPQDSARHTLTVKVLDQAGNGQTLSYEFINGSLRPATDNDLLDEDVVPFPPLPIGIPVTNPVTNPDTGEMGTTMYDWIGGWTSGWGMGSGGGGYSFSGGGSSGSPPRLILPPANDPTIPPPTYLEKMGIILAQAALSLPEATAKQKNRKAAFINRASVLMEIARRVEQTGSYTLMSPTSTLYQDYYEGYTFGTRTQARAEGEVLATDLTNASNAVKVEVLKNELLIAVYTALQQKQPQWVLTDSTETQKLSDQMGVLARIYAALDPQVRPNTPSSTTPDFLTPLWQAQTPVNEHPQPKAVIQQKLDLSVAALADLMTDHPNPRGALQLATNLLQAASEVVYLRESLQDATFVRELMGLAFQYSKYGTLTGTAGSVYGEDLAMALDLLSAPTADGTSRQAQGALGQAFKFLDSTSDKVQLVRLVGNLLEAVKQVPALQSIMGSPTSQREILERVIALATSYLSLNPTGTMSAGQPLKFLETLAQPRTDAILSQGAAEFQAFLADTTTYTERRRLLEMEIKTLKAAKQVQLTSDLPALRQQMGDVTFINALATTSKTYASFNFSSPQAGDAPLDSFLDTLYRAQTPTEINQAGSQLDAFLRDPGNEGVAIFGSDAAKRVKLMDFTTNLLKAAKQTPSLSQPTAQSATLKELVELGRVYASLDPVIGGAPNRNFESFLEMLYRAADDQDVQAGVAELGEFFNEVINPAELLNYERETLLALTEIPELKEELRNPEFFDAVFIFSRYYATSQMTPDVIALGEMPDIDLVSISAGASSPEVDQAVTDFFNTRDGGPVGDRNYWKYTSYPLVSVYLDFFLFFVFKLGTDAYSDGPGKLITRLPDGTYVLARPWLRLGRIGSATLDVRRPTGAPYKMRYIFPNDPPPS